MTGQALTDHHVLMIGGKDSGFRSVSELGVRVTLIQQRSDFSQLQWERASRLFCADVIDAEHALCIAEVVHASDPFDAVVSFSEATLLLAAQIGERLGVTHNPRQAVESTRDKLAMRTLMSDRGLPTVHFACCHEAGDVTRLLELTGGPVIVKPVDGSGSRGVAKVERPEQVAAAWQWCTSGGRLPAIAEEFVSGREYSVESLTLAGHHEVLMVTEKLTTGAPSFVETGHQLPARLDTAVRAEVDRVVTALLGAVGHTWGPAHTEVMVGADGRVTVIETQTRFGGDQIWEMVEHLTGIPLAAATVTAMLGGELRVRRRSSDGGAAIRFFAAEHATVRSVTGAEAARAMPGVSRVEVRATTGSTLGPLRDSWSRQGYVLAYGTDTADAVERAEAAAGRVRFHLDRVDGSGERSGSEDRSEARIAAERGPERARERETR